jgi:hypothetical protein
MNVAAKIGNYLAKGMDTWRFDDILILDHRGGAPSFYPTILSALLLIREVDPRRYARVRRHIQYIVNLAVLRGRAGYAFGQCSIDFEEPIIRNRPYAVARWASTIVHEATHGAISARGVRYTRALRGRIERLCTEEQQRFIGAAVRARPELSKYFDRLREKFDESLWHSAWNMPFWEKLKLSIQLLQKDLRNAKQKKARNRPASK